MAPADESIVRAVLGGKSYEDLPQRARDLITRSAWNLKVKEACARRRLRWDAVQGLRDACKESEYYALVVKSSQRRQQLFPYHLDQDKLKITAFKFYVGVLREVLKKDQSYDQIPNFTAADMVRVTGIGRDEYVPLLQACKAKRLMWKVNRDSAVRDQLPSEPMDLLVEPWWRLRALGGAGIASEAAERSTSSSWSSPTFSSASHDKRDDLSHEERSFLTDLGNGGPKPIDSVGDQRLWRSLYRKGLLHVEVPIGEDDCIAVPPLEGFVSNKDGSGEDSDPVEKLLYGMFFAASARTTIRELAHVLDAPIAEVREAASVACRLGFARRTTQERRASITATQAVQSPQDGAGAFGSAMVDAEGSPVQGVGEEGGASDANEPKGIAFVVDTAVTATLMMGSLLKDQRHAVTLFEAGKLSGRLAVRELQDELSRVPVTGEGEIQFLVNQIQSLDLVLKLICTIQSGETAGLDPAVSGDPEIDILRYEVLSDLPHSTLNRMLSQHYFLVVFMTELPLPLLRVRASSEGPLVHGFPSEMAAMPWMQLLLYQKLQSGLVSLALPKGVQLTRLPPEFDSEDLLLIESWPEEGERGAQASKIVPAAVALGVMNHSLLSSAVLVQKIGEASVDERGDLVTRQVALPIREAGDLGEGGDLADHEDVRRLVRLYRLENAIGYLTLLRTGSVSGGGDGNYQWKLKSVHFGMPLHSVDLCKEVCVRCTASNVFGPENLKTFRSAMLELKEDLVALSREWCAGLTCEEEGFLLSSPVVFDGRALSNWPKAEEEQKSAANHLAQPVQQQQPILDLISL